MTTLLYDPYLSTMGGGERVIYAMAHALAADGGISIAAPDPPAPHVLARRGFDPSFPVLRIPREEFTAATAHFQRVVMLTNELPPHTQCPRSFLMVQFPFQRLSPRWRRQLRASQEDALSRYECLVYSNYVRHWVTRYWSAPSQVLAPEVSLGEYDPLAKKKVILGVGRFFSAGHSKRQDVLIAAYQQLPADVRSSWRLILAGGADSNEQAREFLDDLTASIRPEDSITLMVNVDPGELIALYQQASIFWHATGFGRHRWRPGNAEHFGITTVEAMSYGCIPMSYADGGQTEIIDQSFGVLWKKPEALVRATLSVVQDASSAADRARRARSAALKYGPIHFQRRCRGLMISE